MKKIIVLVLLFVASSASAFTLTLPEPISPPIATQIEINGILINENAKKLVVDYTFKAADGTSIYVGSGRTTSRTWTCQDRPADGEAPASTCFTDVFGYTLRAQDVGKKIGTGLWQLIWARMKADVLKVSGNDIVP